MTLNIIAQIATVYILTRVVTYKFPEWVSCRLCLGFWVALVSCVACMNYYYFGLIWGASYFMATQERK